MTQKFAIIVQAGPQDLGRALHALLYGQELHENGYPVKILFDGAGTSWVTEFENPEHMLAPLYQAVKATGIIAGVCEYCAGHFGAQEATKKGGLRLIAETPGGHPSFVGLVKDGYQPIIL